MPEGHLAKTDTSAYEAPCPRGTWPRHTLPPTRHPARGAPGQDIHFRLRGTLPEGHLVKTYISAYGAPCLRGIWPRHTLPPTGHPA